MDYRIIYVGAQGVFAILFFVLLFLQRLNRRNQKLNNLDLLCILFAATSILDGIWIFLDGVPNYRIWHIILQVVYLSIMANTGYLWFLYTLDLFPAKSLPIRKYRFILIIPVIIQIIFILCSIKTGWVFIVDQNGTYTRGNLHFYSILLNYTYMLIGSFVALKCREDALLTVDKRRFAFAALFPLPILLLASIQLFLPPGLPAMQGGVLVGMLLQYGTSQNVLVTRDYLTDLPNRVAFEQDLIDRMNRFNTSKHLFLLEGDLDKFKYINDTYGHPTGDKALLIAAKALSEVFSKYGAVVFRTGGDEFMVIAEMKNNLSLEEVNKSLNDKLSELAKPEELNLSISLGMIEYDGKKDIRTLIENVDQQLYITKKNNS